MGDARPVLMQLIDEKLLTPGAKKLYVSYYRKRVYADLLTDGSIRFKDTIYISPVPCALQMKRTLNPSLKTDAGWSTMFSAASGESLKDIKDRLNIRKRGPNSRTVNKDKKLMQTVGGPATTTVKPSTTAAAAASASSESTRQQTLQRCLGCKKEATSDFATCTACKRRTHFQCAHPTLDKAPSGSWFCEGCITEQANRILEFLNQTRRVLASHSSTVVVDVDDAGTDGESATEAEPEPTGTPKGTNEQGDDEDAAMGTAGEKPSDKEVEKTDEADAANSDISSLSELSGPMKSLLEETALASVGVASVKLPAKERFIGLLDQLIEEISSKSERTDVITNSTGASLVHLAKTDLVGLVERGLAEIEKASKKPEVEEDADGDEAETGSNAFDVDELVRLFDLRHQVLQSKRQFDHTTIALVERGEQRLRVAETELMELEETRTNESNAVMKIANLIDQYTSDLKNCQERIRLNQVLLESVMQRRKFIRSSNVTNVFLPAYRLIAKHMITSSDQLLATVMLDKLRDIARMINEWEKMECHFETMSAKLQERLDSMKVKKEQEEPSRAPSPVPLFARIKIPPSRRLLERQITNYKANLKSIAANRLRIRHTLQVTLKIAKDESLGEDVIDTTEILLKKCGGPIIIEEPEVVEKVEEIDDENDHSADNEEDANEDKRPREDEQDAEQQAKRQRVEQAAAEAAGEASPVKPEPVPATSNAPTLGAPATLNATANSVMPPPTSVSRVVDVMDSDSDNSPHASSDELSSPKTTFPTSQQQQQSASIPAQMQSVESVRVKKEMVEQATRNEFQPTNAASQRKEPTQVPQRQQAAEPTPASIARKAPTANGDISLGRLNAWESQAVAPPRSEQAYEPSPSLYQQAQQQQQLQQQLQQQQQQAQHRAQEQAQSKPLANQSRSQQGTAQQASNRFPDLQQQMRMAAPQMQVEPPKQQRREAEPQRKNQRSQQQARENALRATQEQQQQQAFQMPQSTQNRQPQAPGVARTHQVSPVRDPFPQLPMPTQARPTPAQTFSALSDAHQPADFGHQRHHPGLPSNDSQQSQHGFQQQQQQQQFQRFQQQQQQQQQQHAGMLHGSSLRPGASSSGHPLYGDMPKPPSMTSSSIPTPQELFGSHSQSHSSDDGLGGLTQSSRTQSVAARQAQQQQQQQQHSFQQQQQQMMHHLNPATSMGQHHAQSHPLASVGSMQYNDPASMRSTYLPSTTDARATNANAFAYGDGSHMMHHNDVFASHLGSQQPPQQAPSMHHLFQNDGRQNPSDFQSQFNPRLFRDPTSDNQMNPGMDGAPDMSEW